MQLKLNPGEEAQLRQTVEMFEVITQTQPLDYQSLDILKEAYLKLGQNDDVVATCRRIGNAYVQLGQLSSAIMEYETILQRIPDDVEASAAVKQLSAKVDKLSTPAASEPEHKEAVKAAPGQIDDGKLVMRKLFVEGKLITDADFEACWPKVDPQQTPPRPIEPFVHVLTAKELVAADKAMRVVSDRSRMAYLPVGRYDLDVELTRSFPRAMCLRWCMLPFDRMSKSLLVGTANPFNKAAIAEMEKAAKCHIIWYLLPTADLLKMLAKAFR